MRGGAIEQRESCRGAEEREFRSRMYGCRKTNDTPRDMLDMRAPMYTPDDPLHV